MILKSDGPSGIFKCCNNNCLSVRCTNKRYAHFRVARSPLPKVNPLLEQPFEFLIEILTGVDEVHEYKAVRMIELVNNAVLGLALGEVI